MANCAISSVISEGVKKVFEIEDHSRIATITKMPYITNRPSRRLIASTTRM